VIAVLEPIQRRYRTIDPTDVLREGAAKARVTADRTVERAMRAAMG
jgi:hypothetical protein